MATDATGDWGQPNFLASGAPEVDVDPDDVSNYFAALAARRFTTLTLALASTPPGNGYLARGDDAPGMTLVRVAGAWRATGRARFADAAARAAVITAPVQGMETVRTDIEIVERYYGTYNVSTNPGGATPAGWYPVDEHSLVAIANRNATALTLTSGGYTLLSTIWVDAELRGIASPVTTGKMTAPIAGWYRFDLHLYTVGTSAILEAFIKKNSVALDTAGTIMVGSAANASNIAHLSLGGLVKLAAADYIAPVIFASAAQPVVVPSVGPPLLAAEISSMSFQFVKPAQV